MKWIKDHAYMGTFQKKLKVKIESAISSKNEIWEIDGSDVVLVSEINIPELISMKQFSHGEEPKATLGFWRIT